MLKVMNLLLLTLSMNILMSISSNEPKITEADRKSCRETFNLLDCDKDRYITVGDVNNFFSDPEKPKKFDGMILEKEKFKEALIHQITNKCDGQMYLDDFISYLYRGASFKKLKSAVEELFPEKTSIKRDEILKKTNFKSLERYRSYLKESYSIKEFIQFYVYNYELIQVYGFRYP